MNLDHHGHRAVGALWPEQKRGDVEAVARRDGHLFGAAKLVAMAFQEVEGAKLGGFTAFEIEKHVDVAFGLGRKGHCHETAVARGGEPIDVHPLPKSFDRRFQDLAPGAERRQAATGRIRCHEID